MGARAGVSNPGESCELVPFLNRWSCPLTPVAARFTEDRRANFDILLPEWLARHNEEVFGGLYLAGVAYLILQWWAVRSW